MSAAPRYRSIVRPVCLALLVFGSVVDCWAQSLTGTRPLSPSEVRRELQKSRERLQGKNWTSDKPFESTTNWTGTTGPRQRNKSAALPRTRWSPTLSAEPTAPRVIEVDFPYPDESQATTEGGGELTEEASPVEEDPIPPSTSGNTDGPEETSVPQDDPAPLDSPGVYRDSERHYSIELAPGWQEMSSWELSQSNLLAGRLAMGNRVRYQAGFRRMNTPPGSFPYILVQPVPLKAKSYAEVERALEQQLPGAFKKVENLTQAFARSATLDGAELDRSRNRVIMKAQIDVRGIGAIQGYSVGHIGAEGMVFVHCYAPVGEFPDWITTFDRIIDTFRYEDNYQFVEQSVAASKAADFLKSVDDPTSTALTGVAMSMAAMMLGSIMRKVYRSV